MPLGYQQDTDYDAFEPDARSNCKKTVRICKFLGDINCGDLSASQQIHNYFCMCSLSVGASKEGLLLLKPTTQETVVNPIVLVIVIQRKVPWHHRP